MPARARGTTPARGRGSLQTRAPGKAAPLDPEIPLHSRSPEVILAAGWASPGELVTLRQS